MIGAFGILRSALDFWFPWSCAVCRKGFEGRGPLCDECSTAVAEMEGEPCCRVCAISLPMHGSPCPYCMGKGPVNFDRVVRLAAFHDPVRVLVHHFKYHRRWGLGEELAERLLRLERVRELLRETDVLVPVPLHWRRQLPRGYNQAEVIARRLVKAVKAGDVVVARVVKRLRHTEMQTHLHSHARRMENLRDAFGLVDGRAIAGKRVTVVDDVWTTGATMQAMARVLKLGKPKSLSAIVVATADPRGLERVKRDEVEVELDL